MSEKHHQLQKELHKVLLNAAKSANSIGYNPHIFNQMLANEGGYSVAKKLIHRTSTRFEKLWELNRLDLSTEAVILQEKFRPLFTKEELEIAKARLSEFGYEVEDICYDLPSLKPSGREREFNYYPEDLKGRVIYEHLLNNQTHRWLDVNILGRPETNHGRDAANILYYLGMKSDYRGVFQGKVFHEVIEILQRKGTEYDEIVRLLNVYSESEKLFEIVKSDIEAQQVEEGNRIEGTKKAYLVNKYERDPKNRKKAIEIQGLNCYACGFNFEDVYGERGTDFIEIHHIKPLSKLEEAVKINPKTDLVPLCANCHRMVHRRKDNVLNIEELKKLIIREKE